MKGTILKGKIKGSRERMVKHSRKSDGGKSSITLVKQTDRNKKESPLPVRGVLAGEGESKRENIAATAKQCLYRRDVGEYRTFSLANS